MLAAMDMDMEESTLLITVNVSDRLEARGISAATYFAENQRHVHKEQVGVNHRPLPFQRGISFADVGSRQLIAKALAAESTLLPDKVEQRVKSDAHEQPKREAQETRALLANRQFRTPTRR